MQHLANAGLLLDQLYKGQRDFCEMRAGFGWQLFLNGFMYIGNWKNDKANGDGTFIHNNGTYVEGKFENNILIEGKIHFHNGAMYSGTMDGLSERFGTGTLYCENSNEVYMECRDGKLLKGKVKFSDPFLIDEGSLKLLSSSSFDFTGGDTRNPMMTDSNTMRVCAAKGLVLKHNPASILEGPIEKDRKPVNFFRYYSPISYESSQRLNYKHGQIVNCLDISLLLQTRERITANGKEMSEVNFFSGVTAVRSSTGGYRLIMKYIDQDEIVLDKPLDIPYVNRRKSVFGKGRYIYKDGEGKTCEIHFDIFTRLEHNPEISDRRLEFDLVARSILKQSIKIGEVISLICTRKPKAYKILKNLLEERPEYQPAEVEQDTHANGEDDKGDSQTMARGNGQMHISQVRDNTQRPTGIITDKQGSSVATVNNEQAHTKEEDDTSPRDDFNPKFFKNWAKRIKEKTKALNDQTQPGYDQQDKRNASLPKSKSQPDKDIEESQLRARENKINPRGTKSKCANPNNTLPSRELESSRVAERNNQRHDQPAKKEKRLSLSKNFDYTYKHAYESISLELVMGPGVTFSSLNPNIKKFKGKSVNGKLEGECHVKYHNGFFVVGNFEQGRLNGHIAILDKPAKYAGHFKDSRPVGRFKREIEGRITHGTFQNGKFVTKVTKWVGNWLVELEESYTGALNGRYTVKLKEHDLECQFSKNEIVPRQEDCLLSKRGADETHTGQLVLESSKRVCLFITEDRSVYKIDTDSRNIDRL